MSNDITLPDAKYGHALDEYYGFLNRLVQTHGGPPGPNQKIVTMNTITPYSIVKDKPYYNMFVLRAYADLVIRRSTAKDAGSPKTPELSVIENANTGDAWSSEYYRFAFPNLTAQLQRYIQKPEVVAKIAALTATWEGAYDKYFDELEKLENAWAAYALTAGLSEADDPTKYYLTKNEWFRKRKAKVEKLYNNQHAMLMEISDLEKAHLDTQGLLFKELKDYLSDENQVKLPIRPELEGNVTSDPTTSPADYDRRPAVYPAGTAVFNDLLDESADGDEGDQFQRGYEILRQRTTTYSHDVDWGASGSARKFLFLKANLSISERTHFEEQIKKIGRIQVGFRAIQEVVIIRGRWYSGAFLKSAEFQKWLEAQPEFREKLRNLTTSVIVGRGLTVKLNFDSDIHQASWRELKIKGSGGISVGGWNFGLSGHYNSRTEWDLKDVTKNAVTFADGPKVCRVLGLRVEDVLGEPPEPRVANSLLVDDEIDGKLLKAFQSGKLSYGEFLEKVHR
jgi:hypothetical protein